MTGYTKRLKTVLILILLLLVGIILAIFIGYRYASDTPAKIITSLGEKTDMSIDHLRQTATRDGKKEWILEAESARLADGGKTAELENLSVIFFMDDGTEAHLRARKGTLNIQSNDFQVNGEISLESQTYRLLTETLQYQHKDRIIIIKAPVEMIANRMRFMASGMIYDLLNHKAILEHDVKGDIQIGPID